MRKETIQNNLLGWRSYWPRNKWWPDVSTAGAMEGIGETDATMINVIVTLPAYHPDMQTWFQQIKTIFLMLRVKSRRIKVANVMQRLPSDVTRKIADILSELPEHNSYDYLKETILICTSCSEEERIKDILQNIMRGDRTPAQILWYMKSQLGSNYVSETVLQTLWLEWLPPSVTQIIPLMS